METKFTPDYQLSLKLAWEKFICAEGGDFSFIRPEIFESWKRSKAAGVNPYEATRNLLSEEELNIRVNANLQLIEVSRPYIERLFSIVEGSGFYILLCDKDGYLLDLIGDPEMIEHGKNKSLLVVGANRLESAVGTNAIGTCLAIKSPIQIWGGEHYLERHKEYVCSGAPIFDPSGNILGCLAITGLYQNVHPHTLGMAISAAGGIAKELGLKKAYEDIELISAQRNSIIQSMASGLILLNESGRVVQINQVALTMLNLPYGEIIGKSLFQFIVFDEQQGAEENIAFLEQEIYNKEVTVYRPGIAAPPKRFNMSVNFVKDGNGKKSGTVIHFNEPRMINALASSISGYKAKYTFDAIIGESVSTKNLIETAKKAAQSASNVLILGESGTGKELLAQSIHSASAFSKGPFVAINCAALPKGLVESELFGYEKGAFTGAGKDGNPGKFELADGGTLFLDEVGDMPLDVQATLLRVIQTKEIVRVGGKYPKSIHVRIIAATNKDLRAAIAEKIFREDLYYRLNVLSVEVPPLRQRAEDIKPLADYFVQLYNPQNTAVISPSAYSLLAAYRWPGNIRQLENVIERAVNITDTGRIEPTDFPAEIRNPDMQHAMGPSDPSQEKAGKDQILRALKQSGGNTTKAAKLLGVSRRTLYRKFEKYEIEQGQYR